MKDPVGWGEKIEDLSWRHAFLRRWEYQTTLPVSWETCMQVKKQQLEPDLEQMNSSKLGKEYFKAVYCHWFNLYAEYIMRNARLG